MNRAPQPVEERFTRKQVLRILGLSDRQLTAWERQGLVEPRRAALEEGSGNGPGKNSSGAKSRATSAKASQRAYTFSDIVTLRTLLQIRRDGVPAARLR